ncbi:hypothetical protein M3G03_06440 [Aestuariimicrobium sp. p3-SID1156]|uniref:hypothetical protein n=1 Tax=Aestuariimicrobium sp. p3-SID1156 TaxID=2916038 RepID=UPI00223A9BD2|nr:hypothetical protein [Aestuariimicrobium sp. p3-SID1156]MCT1459178.1 hypothetical protein [Aestuariimicrobium sp. p3-SID1156]
MAAKKLDKNQIAAISSLIVVGTKGAAEVWDVINKDDRISNTIRNLGGQLAHAVSSGSPQARLEKQLDLIEEYSFKAAERPEQAGDATRWLRQASSIRERLPLVASMKGRSGKNTMRELQRRTSDLLGEIISRDLDD